MSKRVQATTDVKMPARSPGTGSARSASCRRSPSTAIAATSAMIKPAPDERQMRRQMRECLGRTVRARPQVIGNAADNDGERRMHWYAAPTTGSGTNEVAEVEGSAVGRFAAWFLTARAMTINTHPDTGAGQDPVNPSAALQIRVCDLSDIAIHWSSSSRGGATRTLNRGFGDRCSTN